MVPDNYPLTYKEKRHSVARSSGGGISQHQGLGVGRGGSSFGQSSS